MPTHLSALSAGRLGLLVAGCAFGFSAQVGCPQVPAQTPSAPDGAAVKPVDPRQDLAALKGRVFIAPTNTAVTRLVDLAGRVVRSSDGFAPGIYRLPDGALKGSRDAFVVVTADSATVVHDHGGPLANRIIVAGRAFPLDRAIPVLRFDERGGLSFPATSGQRRTQGKPPLFEPRRVEGTDLPLDAIGRLRNVVDKAESHGVAGGQGPDSLFGSLAGRNRATHFIIDRFGTVYQTLDVSYRASEAQDSRGTGILIDFTDREADVRAQPTALNQAQKAAVASLLRLFSRLFPRLQPTLSFR